MAKIKFLTEIALAESMELRYISNILLQAATVFVEDPSDSNYANLSFLMTIYACETTEWLSQQEQDGAGIKYDG